MGNNDHTTESQTRTESTGLAGRSNRSGIAVCLSGGGFRAALFHLGALRRLNELGIFDQVWTFSSVSGGSIFAAHLASCLVASGKSTWAFSPHEFESKIAIPFRLFASKDIRTGPILKRFALPWNWPRRSTQVDALCDLYERDLTALRIRELPTHPNFIFCATELGGGVNWEFQRSRVGQYLLGYQSPPPDWPLAKAVAASSCFPPVFDPMTLGLSPRSLIGGKMESGVERDDLVRSARLSDGGVYDNLGLEPAWDTHSVVFVSDGGAPFRLQPNTTILRQWKRYFDIASNQVSALRKRWLITNYDAGLIDGAYWGVGSSVSRYGREYAVGYSKDLAVDVISGVRTDLDAFSKAEQCVLENHGYCLADAAIKRHSSTLLPHPIPNLAVPHPEWMDESRVRTALAESHKRIRFL